MNATRITVDPTVMGGEPCIRGLRVTVGTIVGLAGSGHSPAEILKLYPYLEEEDIHDALAYAARPSDEPDFQETVTAVLSEGSLAGDWNRAEEDEAWSHFQPHGSFDGYPPE